MGKGPLRRSLWWFSWNTELVSFCNDYPIFAFVLSSFVVVLIVLQGEEM